MSVLTNILKSVSISMLLVVPVSFAQSVSEDEAGRPEMGTLFLRPDQRRILEGIRQGVVEEEVITNVAFTPILVFEDTLPQDGEKQKIRSTVYKINALITNRRTGKTTALIGEREVELDKPDAQLQRDGLSINLSDSHAVLEGSDDFSRSKFEVKVGQSIGTDGQINESLPVVVHHTKNNIQ